MRIAWRTEGTRYGNGYGYARTNDALRHAFVAAGGELDVDAPLTIAVQYPLNYCSVPGRRNILLTMYENADLPDAMVRALQSADAIIVPSTFCRDIFLNATDRPIYVCPLGVNPSVFVPVARPRPRNRPFRWLWVGAHNARKGWGELLATWDRVFAGRKDCELYLKTTGTEFPDCIGQGQGRRFNVTLDTRNVSDLEMSKLYAAADGFVLPHMGEGFSLVALEAMSSALPCVMTVVTGETEYADDSVCRPVQYDAVETGVAEIDGAAFSDAWVLRADPESIANEMMWVMNHWERARRMGLRAAKRAQQFTWTAAGRRLREVLDDIATGMLPDAEEVTHGSRVSL